MDVEVEVDVDVDVDLLFCSYTTTTTTTTTSIQLKKRFIPVQFQSMQSSPVQSGQSSESSGFEL